MHPSIVDSHKKLLEPGSSNVGCEVRLVAKGTEICDADKINREMRETELPSYQQSEIAVNCEKGNNNYFI